jgi:hypothetical protein
MLAGSWSEEESSPYNNEGLRGRNRRQDGVKKRRSGQSTLGLCTNNLNRVETKDPKQLVSAGTAPHDIPLWEPCHEGLGISVAQ